MPGQPIDIQWPAAGLQRGVGYQSESPYACDDALNVWPRDPFEERMRGGSRPGLKEVLASGVTGPVHLLANLRVIEGTGTASQTQFTDEFISPAEAFGAQWSQATWIMPPADGEFHVASGYVYIDSHGPIQGGPGILSPEDGRVLQDINQTSAVHVISIDVLGNLYNSQWPTPPTQDLGFATGEFQIFAGMNNTTPKVTTDGLIGSINLSTGALSFSSYNAGVLSFTSMPGPINATGTLSLTVEASGSDFTLRFGSSVLSLTQAPGAGWGRRMGFGYVNTHTQMTGQYFRHRIGYFRVSYTGSAATPNRNVIVVAGGTSAGGGGEIDLKFEDTPGTLVSPVSTAGGNPRKRQLVSAEVLGKLYIAGEDAEGVWVFDPAGAGSLTDLTGPSTNLYAIVAWRSRLGVVDRDDQYNLSFSAVGDPTNWTYASTVGAACQLNTSGIDTGRLSEPITCPIAHSDDYLVIGCHSSLYVLRGDPTYQGQIDRLSSSIGIVSPTAYTRGPNGETLFLSYDGLYGLPPGVAAYPQSGSREPLPKELRDIDPDQYRVLMAYDVRNRGVFIGVTPDMGGGGIYYWLDWQTRSFWPMSFNASHEPTAVVYRTADSSTEQRLLFGCRDGRLRVLDLSSSLDDGVPFTTNVLIGPVQLGGGGYFDGMLTEIVGQTAAGSGTVELEVLGGNCIEAARRSQPLFRCNLYSGKNITHRPRLRFNACYLRLRGTPPWGLENLTLVRERLGKQRL